MLIDDYRNAIRARNYSSKTFEAYWPHVVEFLRFCKQGDQWVRPEQLDSDDVTRFLTHMAVTKNVSASTQNQALAALVFLYRFIIKRPLSDVDAVRAKTPKHLPVVMSRDEVARILKNLSGVYLLQAQLMYGCGLRLERSARGKRTNTLRIKTSTNGS